MPFDAPFDEVNAIAVVGDKPNLRALSFALRNEWMWPKGFRWDYSDCLWCAMGLAAKLWNDPPFSIVDLDRKAVAYAFRMDFEMSQTIFWRLNRRLGVDIDEVTPADVADAIDKYLSDPAYS